MLLLHTVSGKQTLDPNTTDLLLNLGLLRSNGETCTTTTITAPSNSATCFRRRRRRCGCKQNRGISGGASAKLKANPCRTTSVYSMCRFALCITEPYIAPFLQGGKTVEGESVQGQPEGSRCSGWPHPVRQPVPRPPANPGSWAVPKGDSCQGQTCSRIPTHHGQWKSQRSCMRKLWKWLHTL